MFLIDIPDGLTVPYGYFLPDYEVIEAAIEIVDAKVGGDDSEEFTVKLDGDIFIHKGSHIDASLTHDMAVIKPSRTPWKVGVVADMILRALES